MTPATPETYVIEVNPQSSLGYTMTPVLGWTFDEKRPLPMTLGGVHTLIGGDSAVLFPGGMVHSPQYALAFESTEAWLESNPGSAKRRPRASPKMVRQSQEPEEDEGSSAYDIEWTAKPFKSNSFWHYDDGEYEFVFIVEGGADIPKASDKVVKIKRDELQALKKNIDLLDVNDIMNADPLPADDDDDVDDLI